MNPVSYTVSGTVIDSSTNQPLAGAVVKLDSSQLTTGSDGKFFFPGVAQGSHVFSVTKTGYSVYTLSLTVTSNLTDFPVNLVKDEGPTGYNLQVHVIDNATNQALSATVTLKQGLMVVGTETGSDVTFSELQAGSYQVTANANGYTSSTVTVNVQGDTEKTIALTKENTSTEYTLSGTVTDNNTGAALNNVKIQIDSKTTYTTADGKYSVQLQAGSYTLTATKSGYQDYSQSVTVNSAKDLSIKMFPIAPSTYSVTVNVVDASNNPINGASTKLTNTATNVTVGTKTGSTVTFTEVSAGNYKIDVTATNYKAYSQSFSVSTSNVTLKATLESNQSQTATASGTVTLASSTASQTSYTSLKKLNAKTVSLQTHHGQPEYNGLLVKFKDNVQKDKANQIFAQAQVSQSSLKKHEYGIYTMKVTGDPAKTMASLKKNSDVEYVQYNYINRTFGIPNDEYYSYQWNLSMIKLPAAWDLVKGSDGNVVVAVLDTGMRSNDDLQPNLVQGYDTVDNMADPTDDISPAGSSHGSHVATIIGAVTNNSYYLAGAGWNIKVMPIKVFSKDGNNIGAYDSDIAEGIIKATDSGAKVINMSLGIGGTVPADHPAVEQALKYAYEHGVSIFVATGNESASSICYPASSQYSFAVGAVDYQGNRTSYSNYGEGICITAPGGDGNTQNATSWIYGYDATQLIGMVGTSQATPHVAAIAGLLYTAGVTDPKTVYQILIDTATSKNDTVHYGAGIVNAEAAVLAAKNQSSIAVTDILIGAATVTDDQIQFLTDLVQPAQNGSYTVNDIPTGVSNVYIIGFIDCDNDGSLGPGDYFGNSSPRTYSAGENATNLNFTVSKLSGTTAQKALKVPTTLSTKKASVNKK